MRQRRPSTRYNPQEYVLTYRGEAMAHNHNKEWLEAMNNEMKSLQDNHTYDLVKFPKGKRALKRKKGL